MTESVDPSFVSLRAEWLRTLNLSPESELQQLAGALLQHHHFEWLRRPEVGLVMLRARIGGTGDRFNLGEATVTRCAVRYTGASGHSTAGVGHVLGRAEQHAGLIARLDALLQVPELHAPLWRSVVGPLQQRLLQRRQAEQLRTEASRVHFHTLQPEL